MLGVMLDCSRNAVMKAERVKQFADIIRKMGYDTLMLYTEETYEIKSQPLFGYMRGRYTKEELKDIDLYCKSIGIDVLGGYAMICFPNPWTTPPTWYNEKPFPLICYIKGHKK